jgi:hypothetical protein
MKGFSVGKLVKAQLVKLDEKEPDLDKLLTDMSSLYQI